VLWVHDYHFVPLAAEVRARGFNGHIGFFLHTPFPPLDILCSMPPHREFLRWLTAYDLVGFQTEVDQHAFAESACRDINATRSGGKRLRYGRREIKTGVFPIGADANEIAEQTKRGRRTRQLKTLKSSLEGRRLII